MTDKEKLIWSLERWIDWMDEDAPVVALAVLAFLKNQPDITRCKDCKYWHKTIYDTPKWLPCMSVQTSGKWYCADGEREEENA